MQALARIAVVLGTAMTLACGLVIGLEEKRGRPKVQANDSDVPPVEMPPGPPRFCFEAGANALFCDDFDEPGQLPSARWHGVPNGLSSPVLVGDASLLIESLDYATSVPSVLEVSARREYLGSAGAALMFETFQNPLPKGAGVVLSLDVQLRSFEDLEPPDAKGEPSDVGPYPEILDEAKVAIASIGGFASVGRYASIITVSKLNVAVAEGVDQDYQKITNYTRVGAIKLEQVTQGGFARVFLATGPRERILDYVVAQRGKPLDCPPDAGYVTAGWLGALRDEGGCIPADPENAILQGKSFVVAIGAIASTASAGQLRYDTVRVDQIGP
jgi:hypothetical protein